MSVPCFTPGEALFHMCSYFLFILFPAGGLVKLNPAPPRSMQDLQGGWEAYIRKIEPKVAEAGIGKIVAPRSWVPRKKGYDDVDLLVEKPIRCGTCDLASSDISISSSRFSVEAFLTFRYRLALPSFQRLQTICVRRARSLSLCSGA